MTTTFRAGIAALALPLALSGTGALATSLDPLAFTAITLNGGGSDLTVAGAGASVTFDTTANTMTIAGAGALNGVYGGTLQAQPGSVTTTRGTFANPTISVFTFNNIDLAPEVAVNFLGHARPVAILSKTDAIFGSALDPAGISTAPGAGTYGSGALVCCLSTNGEGPGGGGRGEANSGFSAPGGGGGGFGGAGGKGGPSTSITNGGGPGYGDLETALWGGSGGGGGALGGASSPSGGPGSRGGRGGMGIELGAVGTLSIAGIDASGLNGVNGVTGVSNSTTFSVGGGPGGGGGGGGVILHAASLINTGTVDAGGGNGGNGVGPSSSSGDGGGGGGGGRILVDLGAYTVGAAGGYSVAGGVRGTVGSGGALGVNGTAGVAAIAANLTIIPTGQTRALDAQGTFNETPTGFSAGYQTTDLQVNAGGSATATAAVTSTNDLILNGGVVTASAGWTVGAGGTITGSGTIQGNVTNSGTLAPGHSPGEIDVLGNLTLGSGGETDMQLGGLATNQYDRIVVSDDASTGPVEGQLVLDGTLDVTLIDGFNPMANSFFDVFVALDITGAFDTIDLPTLDTGLDWDEEIVQGVDGAPDVFRLSVATANASAPEPASLAAFAFGLIGLGIVRRRR